VRAQGSTIEIRDPGAAAADTEDGMRRQSLRRLAGGIETTSGWSQNVVSFEVGITFH